MGQNISRREFIKKTATAGIVLTAGSALLKDHHVLAKDLEPIRLSRSSSEGSAALMKILEKRRSIREFSPEPLPVPVLSNLLWAACGVNRPDGRRTAPTARNRQEIDVYVATNNGLYLYDAKENVLRPILSEDIRELTGVQSYVKQAPVNLVFVADTSRMGASSTEEKNLYAAAATGFISQNVYLFCAAESLATVVRAYIDKPVLAKAMKLRSDQIIMLAQSIGYPQKGI
jgi:nitroreductase